MVDRLVDAIVSDVVGGRLGPQDQVVTNQRVQEALRLVFAKFTELQSVRQVHVWLRDEGIALPRRMP